MITQPTDILPKIEWERGDLFDTDDHMKFYACSGESEDGRKWSGDWEVTDGELIEITNIEETI